jgi:hypothetical protein
VLDHHRQPARLLCSLGGAPFVLPSEGPVAMHPEKPMHREERTYWCSSAGKPTLASMKSISSRAGVSVAAVAALMSGAWGVFVPYGYPWPTIAWAILACGLAVWVGIRSIRLTPRMTDVIGAVEAESPRTSAAAKRGVVSTGSTS